MLLHSPVPNLASVMTQENPKTLEEYLAEDIKDVEPFDSRYALYPYDVDREYHRDAIWDSEFASTITAIVDAQPNFKHNAYLSIADYIRLMKREPYPGDSLDISLLEMENRIISCSRTLDAHFEWKGERLFPTEQSGMKWPRLWAWNHDLVYSRHSYPPVELIRGVAEFCLILGRGDRRYEGFQDDRGRNIYEEKIGGLTTKQDSREVLNRVPDDVYKIIRPLVHSRVPARGTSGSTKRGPAGGRGV